MTNDPAPLTDTPGGPPAAAHRGADPADARELLELSLTAQVLALAADKVSVKSAARRVAKKRAKVHRLLIPAGGGPWSSPPLNLR